MLATELRQHRATAIRVEVHETETVYELVAAIPGLRGREDVGLQLLV